MPSVIYTCIAGRDEGRVKHLYIHQYMCIYLFSCSILQNAVKMGKSSILPISEYQSEEFVSFKISSQQLQISENFNMFTVLL